MRKTATFPARDFQLFRKQLISWAGNFFSCVCFDSNNYPQVNHDWKLLAAAGELTMLPANENVFTSLKSFHNQSHDWLFGFLSYDLKNEIEPKVFSKPDVRFNGVPFPPGYFFQPKHLVEVYDSNIVVHTTENPEEIFQSIINTAPVEFSFPEEKKLQHRTSRAAYIAQVNLIRERIAHGDLYEMNLCQEFFLENSLINPAAAFIRLNEISPSPFACFVKHNSNYLMSASPETFLMKRRSKIFSQPMKGTIKRNAADSKSDSMLKEKLRNDAKERAENVMIVDLVRNDLARSAIPGSVQVDELFGVYTFPQVHQMISTVSATLRDDVHFVDAIRNAFPMGSMTGAPKVMAMQLIDQYEKVKRGLFSGSVGFITPNGDFDFNVVIRSLLYNASTGYLSFQTGSAITFDCVAEKEYDECLLKASAIMQALNIEVSVADGEPTGELKRTF